MVTNCTQMLTQMGQLQYRYMELCNHVDLDVSVAHGQIYWVVVLLSFRALFLYTGYPMG